MRRALALAAGLMLLARPAGAQEISPVELEMVAWIDAHEAEAIAFLQRAVDINSGTMNHAGVRAVGELFRAELDALGFATRWIEMPPEVHRAGHLFAEREGRPGSPRLLLIGHLDTVFEADHPFQRWVREGDRARGPGALDMKGGDVAILTALGALAAAGALDDVSVTVALIGDEESAGLPLATSRGDLIEAGKRADAALAFESGDPGRAVIARRGASNWTLRVTGRQGHSSGIFREGSGSGAIYETARILWRFHQEVRGPRTLTFNPGIVLGGTEVTFDDAEKRGTAFGKTNVIAQTALVDGDLRFLSEAEKEEARSKMRAIVADHLPGTSAEITFENKYPAMEPTEGNRELLALYDAVSADLGFGRVEPYDPASRGAGDISFVAPFVDGLDGLGPSGQGAHSPNETLEVPSVAAAAKRAAVFIHRLAAARRAPAAAGGTAAAEPAGVINAASGDTVTFAVPPPDSVAPDLVSQLLHHAVPGHSVCPGQTGRVTPGARTCFQLLYGWRGAEPAHGVTLSIGVPAGVTLVGASREPAARTAAGWRWELGTLAPGTYGSILLEAEIGSDAAPGSTVRLDAYISGAVAEAEPGNNGSWVVVRVVAAQPPAPR